MLSWWGVSVVAGRVLSMAGGARLRRIADSLVAAALAGVRIRTRIHPTDAEAEALTAIGGFVGSVYRGELTERVRLGRLDREAQAVWRVERKRAVTAVASSRWAGAVTRAVEDQYQLGMRGLGAHVSDLRAAVEVLEQRCALRPGELAPADGAGRGGRSRRPRGYRSAAERFCKTRRLAALRERLAAAERALAAGRPSITVGGNRLWRTRHHLDAAGMTERQWRQRWEATRLLLTADGESGKAGGNETIRVDGDGRVRIKIPAALVSQLGSHVVIDAPIRFGHRGDEWADRVALRRAIRYDVSYDSARDRWYLDASWRTTPQPAALLEELRGAPVLGVDLNDGHLAACVLDSSGNPAGEPVSIDVITSGLAASRRDGRVRAAITALLDHAGQRNCSAVVVENLDFADARATGRETLGRDKRGKRLRRTVAGIPTRRLRDRMVAMAARRGIAVIGVDPAYTSRWGAQHWRKPLQQQTSDQSTVTVHHGAAAAIGRRGLGLRIRRRPAGPRSGQRTAAGTPPARPNPHPSTTPRRHGSSGPPHPHDGCRSTGKHPPPAANTVRAAQDSLLLTHQER
jgi:IS605 OrfB family transposase